HLKNCKRQ
ncbi:hypothetical protein D032_0602B, partial [Vibrio parahaemolyticus V14/01]